MNLITTFLTGLFLCNAIPHLVSGLRGEAFPTPFAKPPARGLSSPLVNFLWGTFNAAVGAGLLHRQPWVSMTLAEMCAALLGFVVIGVYLSLHFGKVRPLDRTHG